MEIHTASILNQKDFLLIRSPLVLLGMTNGQLCPLSLPPKCTILSIEYPKEPPDCHLTRHLKVGSNRHPIARIKIYLDCPNLSVYPTNLLFT